MNPNKAELVAFLTLLGNNAEEVAKSLDMRGLRGIRCVSGECPVSNYIKMYYPDNTLSIGDSIVSGCSDGYIIVDDIAELHGVQAFLLAFDDGQYAWLDSAHDKYKYKVCGRRKSGEVEILYKTNDPNIVHTPPVKEYVSVWREAMS